MDWTKGWMQSLTFAICIFSAALALEEDPKGYVVYCPCMGRFGNQASHFLGALNFAKGVDRTLILPPWVEYRPGSSGSVQIPFDTYFKVEAVNEFHRAITMEEFMKELAPTVWPVGKRTVFCYQARGGKGGDSCNAKGGNPFGPFWDNFNIDFDENEFYSPMHYDAERSQVAQQWAQKYPPKKYKVLAFTGAPGFFPVREKDVFLQKYLRWSDSINKGAEEFISENIKAPFLGIHMRNGIDWQRACEHVSPGRNMFDSAQCLGFGLEHGQLTKDLCFPPDETVLAEIKEHAKRIKAKTIYVATDNQYMIGRIEQAVKDLKKVKVVRDVYPSPHKDLAILAKADHFIGNCVSTFSGFAARERLVNGKKKSSFWAHEGSPHDEL